MDKTAPASIDEYLASQPLHARKALKLVRETILSAFPDAEERISYRMPAFKWRGSYLAYFAAWEDHYSLYPASKSVVAAFKQDLAPYKLGKGTIRFPLSEPVPVDLIERIVKFRASEIVK